MLYQRCKLSAIQLYDTVLYTERYVFATPYYKISTYKNSFFVDTAASCDDAVINKMNIFNNSIGPLVHFTCMPLVL